MRTLSDQTKVEKNLHSLFGDLVMIIQATAMTAQAGGLPEEVVKKLTDSIVDAMEGAQKDVCIDCPILDTCISKSKHKKLFNRLRFNSVEGDKEQPAIISLLDPSNRRN